MLGIRVYRFCKHTAVNQTESLLIWKDATNVFWPWKKSKSNMARLGGFGTYISLCGYREIKNSSGIEDSSWTSATEKINLPCTLAGLYFIYQVWECLPSVALEPQITWCYCPRAAVTSFCTAQKKTKRPRTDYCRSVIH